MRSSVARFGRSTPDGRLSELLFRFRRRRPGGRAPHGQGARHRGHGFRERSLLSGRLRERPPRQGLWARPDDDSRARRQPGTFVRVNMTSQRTGLLSHVGWLASQANPKDPSTIQRGVYIARHVLCLALGRPPRGAPVRRSRDPRYDRQRPWKRPRKGAAPRGCHGRVINPLGFALEGFDALGEFRTRDGHSGRCDGAYRAPRGIRRRSLDAHFGQRDAERARLLRRAHVGVSEWHSEGQAPRSGCRRRRGIHEGGIGAGDHG